MRPGRCWASTTGAPFLGGTLPVLLSSRVTFHNNLLCCAKGYQYSAFAHLHPHGRVSNTDPALPAPPFNAIDPQCNDREHLSTTTPISNI
ncbi:hypothetical protein T440DRAFT_466499 [Plenodomus tracheiphilus IPT5]|uniref:Uncharacterized protein n=1 Tax=Plenodomus tracheiphilus IPT5 TaxID=1408161 RepID=A0A6A7BEM4_9PLEO|nr:hypothetical protein T440DRAFT_466499 [Plenodomus tracheiphilus IPT5]